MKNKALGLEVLVHFLLTSLIFELNEQVSKFIEHFSPVFLLSPACIN